MNVLVLSPAFPPNVYLFCTSLSARGETVLGVGDSPRHDVRDELAYALTEYSVVPSLSDDEAVYRATAGLIAKHGRIDHVVSHIEIWLDLEARLRDDFNIPGLRVAEMASQRSKMGMAKLFASAGIAHPPGELATTLERAKEYAREHGYPLILKPDTGAGSHRTFTLRNEAELSAAFENPVHDSILQPFVEGDIVTFDGLTDARGEIVFCISHRYDTGILQVVSGGLDGHYYSARDIPPGLEEAGRRAVRAFDVRSRFFHLEFFETPRGYVGLEMNLRPPGGFTTDMMNYACDFDAYDLWARAVTGDSFEDFAYERTYNVGHAGRRDGNTYLLDHDELLRELGSMLVLWRRMPKEFAAMQGNVMYLLRSADITALREGIRKVQAKPA